MEFSSYIVAGLLTIIAVLVTCWLRAPRSRLRGLPGPKPSFLLGNIGEIVKKGPLNALRDWSQEHGPMFKYSVATMEFVAVSDPELVKDVTTRKHKSFRYRPPPPEAGDELLKGIFMARGQHLANARGATMPLFHSQEYLEAYMGLMTSQLDKLCDELAALPPDQAYNLQPRLQALALDIFCSAAFGDTLDDSIQADSAYMVKVVEEVIRQISAVAPSTLLGILVSPALGKLADRVLSALPGTEERRRKANLVYRRQAGAAIVQRRLKETGFKDGTRRDVISQLLRGRPNAEGEVVTFSQDDLMTIISELIVAGADTTANTVAFAVFLLATHPRVCEKVTKEIKQQAAEFPPTSYANLDKYPYVQMVVKEVLRLYPTATQLVRVADEDVQLGPALIPAGTPVIVPVFLMHQDPKNFKDPGVFLPERFDPSDEAASQGNNMGAYIPFGAGPRMCLGYKFALQEASLALVRLYSRFEFRMTGKLAGLQGLEAIEAMETETGAVLKPKNGVHVTVTPRT